MTVKPVIVVTTLMLLSFVKNFGTLSQRTMSNITGIYSVAYVTVPTNVVAKSIARVFFQNPNVTDQIFGLVEKKLAACVNIIPQITSVYEWENDIKEDSELLLMIKTRTEAVDAMTNYVRGVHPYTVCEVISLPIENGNEQYLNWIGDVVPALSRKPQV